MRGFIFSLDMVFAATAIMAALVLIGFALQQSSSPSSADAVLSMHARDAALMRVFGGGATPSIPSTTGAFACASVFERVSSTSLQLPSLSSSWSILQSCEAMP